MGTPVGHILVHLQSIADKQYIRLVNVATTKAYFHEFNIVYNNNTETELSVNDPCIRILYNCGDLYERLIHDVKFKKFKDVDIQHVTEDKSLALVSGGIDIQTWFSETFVPWVESKVHMYIEDADESFVKTVDEINWKDIDSVGYFKQKTGDKTIHYELQDAEVAPNGMYVLSLEHILAVLVIYVRDYLSCKKYLDANELSPNDTVVVIKSFENNRGIYIDKQILSPLDITVIATNIAWIPSTFAVDMMTSKYFKSMTINESNMLNNFLSNEGDVFSSFYSFLDSPTEDCNNCMLKVFDIQECSPLYSRQKQIQDASIETVVDPPLNSKIIYKNEIDRTICMFDDDILYFKEYTKVSDFYFKSDLIEKVLNSINHTHIPKDFVSEMKQLVAILNDEPLETGFFDTSSALQHGLTARYVTAHKNDALHTSANVVIENVHKFLNEEMPKPAVVNRNQIGEDLVNLGVKKSRRAKGYVYGIEDTSKPQPPPPQKPVIVLDNQKVERGVHELRAIPKVVATNIDETFAWSKPGKFMFVNSPLHKDVWNIDTRSY